MSIPDQTWRTHGYLIVQDSLSRSVGSAEQWYDAGLDPDKVWAIGDVSVPGLLLRAKAGALEFKSRLGTDVSPIEHVANIRARLEPQEDAFLRMSASLRVELRLVVYVVDSSPAIALPVEDLRWLVRLNAGLDVDIIVTEKVRG